MQQANYFDYNKLARQLRVSQDRLKELKKEIREEFPHDPLMFELHMVRALMSEYGIQRKESVQQAAQ